MKLLPRSVIVDGLPGLIRIAGGLPSLPPPSETTVQIPGVHVRDYNPVTALDQLRRVRPLTGPPTLHDDPLLVQILGQVRPPAQIARPHDDVLGFSAPVGSFQSLQRLQRELAPQIVQVGVIAVAPVLLPQILLPTFQVDLVSAQVEYLVFVAQFDEIGVELFQHVVHVGVFRVELAARGFAAVQAPRTFVHAHGQVSQTLVGAPRPTVTCGISKIMFII